MFWTIDEIKRANSNLGHHFFDKTSVRFFASRVLGGVYGGRYFVTSERFRGSDGYRATRLYTIREAQDNGEVDTVGEFQAYTSARAARKHADKLGRDYILSRSTPPTANGRDLEIFESLSRSYRNNP